MSDYNAAFYEYQKIKQRLENEKEYFTVVFCGVFSSGKTSLINCLLDYPSFKLPTGINPVTKLVTRIRYGERIEFFCIINGRSVSITEGDFVEMVKGSRLYDGIDEIDIMIPSKILKNGVEFIDTPGFLDEMGGELERVSRRAVEEADLAVLCTNALQLGDRFEKEFIEELEQSIGNYFMVVNRMDNLHDEETAPVHDKAVFLMNGKGGLLVPQTLGTNIFYSSANGKYINLGGFDAGISMILGSLDLRKVISASTNRINSRWKIGRLKDRAEFELENLYYLLETQRNIHQSQISKIELENSLRDMDAGAKKRRLFTKCLTELDRKTSSAVNQITNLYESGQSADFCENVTRILMSEYYQVARMVDDYLGGSFSTVDGFNYAINHIEVPEPAFQKVKARGVIKRMQNNARARKDGLSARDDGFDTIYNDYHTPAINAVKCILLPELQNIVNGKMDSYREKLSAHIDPKSGIEDKLASTERQIEKWLGLIADLDALNGSIIM